MCALDNLYCRKVFDFVCFQSGVIESLNVWQANDPDEHFERLIVFQLEIDLLRDQNQINLFFNKKKKKLTVR